MRKFLFALTALVGLAGAGAATTASATPVQHDPLVTSVQFYYGGYDPRGGEWREREWRHHEWERHRRWEEQHRWHEFHRYY